ncbi:hypothetical protein C8J57DRAFT_1243289 [Mycena rebaudengoi]|nr:hypothetical protein C8J57DRAFT_1243289 [Mycena rebaudengoi]
MQHQTVGDGTVMVVREEIHTTAVMQQNLSHLSFMVLHAGGQRNHDGYLMFNTSLLNGNILHLPGHKDQFLVLVITNLTMVLPHLNVSSVDQISALMRGALFSDNSNCADFKFLAWHCSLYNWYAEQGNGAPKDTHPYFLQKKNTSKVNHSQCVPLYSQECCSANEHSRALAPVPYSGVERVFSSCSANERSRALVPVSYSGVFEHSALKGSWGRANLRPHASLAMDPRLTALQKGVSLYWDQPKHVNQIP